MRKIYPKPIDPPPPQGISSVNQPETEAMRDEIYRNIVDSWQIGNNEPELMAIAAQLAKLYIMTPKTVSVAVIISSNMAKHLGRLRNG